MGLLPIFLALAGFIFLWSLVNHNSFAARQQSIGDLREAEDLLTSLRKETLDKLTNYLTSRGVTIPAYLLQNGPADPETSSRQHTVELAEQWHEFIPNHTTLSGDPALVELIEQFDDITSRQVRTQTRLQAAINEYNRLRSQMPFRLIAVLFGFRPIETSY